MMRTLRGLWETQTLPAVIKIVQSQAAGMLKYCYCMGRIEGGGCVISGSEDMYAYSLRKSINTSSC